MRAVYIDITEVLEIIREFVYVGFSKRKKEVALTSGL